MHEGRWRKRLAAAAAWAATLAFLATPAWSQQQPGDLTSQTIEDLMNIQVTSVSKTDQSLSHTAAAIFVINEEDIRRSGARNIPDLLRMVPGMDVAQINGDTWAITARGFNARFGNELLALVDGRPIYTQVFGGVFWDALNMPMEDIERIEVIRGPGGSVWGANAVNAVINIITKKAADTHGALLVTGAGSVDQGFGTAQYGGKAFGTDYRAYTRYFNQDHQPGQTGGNGGDGWHALQAGFRTDSTVSPKDALMFQGDIYTNREGIPATDFNFSTESAPQPVELQVNFAGGFIQGVWDHTISDHSDTMFQISYDTYERNDILQEGRGTLNLDFQHHFSGWARQEIVWGLSYQYSSSHSNGDLYISFVPENLATQLYGSFVQDQVTILPRKLFLTLGTKLEHNHYTGFGLMPSARVAWTPSAHATFWAAISRAERTPAEIDAAISTTYAAFPGPGGVPTVLTFLGNPHVENEDLTAYEAGYRTVVLKQLSIDLTAYYDHYTQQETTEPKASFLESTPTPPHIVMPSTYENLMHGETSGAEVAATWQITPRWTVGPGYAFEEIHMHLAPTSQDTDSVSEAEGSTPVQSAELRSHLTLWHGFSWDTSAYFVGRLTNPVEPSYTRLDSQLSWHFAEHASLSLVGQNLAKNLHEEFVDSTGSAGTTEVKSGAYAKLSWQF